MAPFFILDSKSHSASFHMEKDALLLENLKKDTTPILRFYEFERPSFTYGHFTNLKTLLNLEEVQSLGLDFAKRPTGGGITFHMSDFTFSVLIPKNHEGFFQNTLKNYAYIHEKVAKALSKVFQKKFSFLMEENKDSLGEGFCSAKPTKYDLLLSTKKVCGAAQRKKEWGYLHQGSIFLAPIEPYFLKDLFLDDRIEDQMKQNCHYLVELKELSEYKRAIKNSLTDVFLNG
ncbi:MAG: Octanoyltransferase LipM [Chlamydiae bacterium]|nr:Octanoyltransferase LipM [Chlamydiota bacterium]